jgi:hypothetical protein
MRAQKEEMTRRVARELPAMEGEGVVAMRNALGIFGLIVLSVLPVDGIQPLTLAVTPARSFAPATMRIRVRIEPSVQNRAMTVVADGSDFYRSSAIPLEGDQAPKTVELRFSDLPGGDYEVYAILTDALGHQRAIARQSVTVMSMIGGH